MGETALISEGLTLMLVGMSTVFVFLTILVFATSLMSHLVAQFFPTTDTPLPISSDAMQAQEEEIAAAVAAVNLHRQRHSPD